MNTFVTINIIDGKTDAIKFATANIEYVSIRYVEEGGKLLVVKTNSDIYTFVEGIHIKNADVEFKKF